MVQLWYGSYENIAKKHPKVSLQRNERGTTDLSKTGIKRGLAF